MRRYITTLNKDIIKLKKQIGILPCELLDEYNNSVYKNITKEIVIPSVYVKMQLFYKSLIEYKQIVNSIDNSILSISKSKSDILNYIQNNYPYCEEYIKEELNKFLTNINLDNSNEYNKARMYRLINEQKILDNKLTNFLNKVVKINNIISDNKNIYTKIIELNKLKLKCDLNKEKLELAKIGNRYNSIIKPDFDYYVSDMKSNLEISLKYLNDGDFNNSLLYYGNYVTSYSLLIKLYDIISKLLIDYNNSDKYIKSKNGDIVILTVKIENNIFKLGVQKCNKIIYEEYKNDILKYKKLLSFDFITASEKLKEIIINLEKLLQEIENNISYYNKKKM